MLRLASKNSHHPHPYTLNVRISVFLLPAIVFADDFKTVDGKDYKNATVVRIEADGIVVKTKGGIGFTGFSDRTEASPKRCTCLWRCDIERRWIFLPVIPDFSGQLEANRFIVENRSKNSRRDRRPVSGSQPPLDEVALRERRKRLRGWIEGGLSYSCPLKCLSLP